MNATEAAIALRRLLPIEQTPLPIYCYDSIDSTNAEGKRMTLPTNINAALILAGTQTAGRGRMERAFYSPADTGLYMTLVLRVISAPRSMQGLTPAVAVAAVRAITQATDRGLPPPTALWNALQRCLGIQTPSELIAFVYSHPKADIAALCRTVSDCAQAGDPTSTALLQQAGADLAVLVRLLVERAPTTDALPLCCSGSLLTKNAIVRAAFETALHAAALPISSVFDLQEPTRGVLSLYKTTT